MSKLTESQLDALYRALPDHSHLNALGLISIAQWSELNRPYLWRIDETVTHGSSTYHAAFDSGHGCMALFLDDTLIETTFTNIITTTTCVMLAPCYYHLPKTLWF